MRLARFRGFGDAGYTGDLAAQGQTAMEDVISGLRWALTACKARYSLAASPPAEAQKIIADAGAALDGLQGRMGSALAAGASGISEWRQGVKFVADSIASVAKTLGDSNAASVATSALDSWEDFDAAVAAVAKAQAEAQAQAEAAAKAKTTSTSSGGGGGGGGGGVAPEPTPEATPDPSSPERRGLPVAPRSKPKRSWFPVLTITAAALYIFFRKKA